MKLHAYLGGVVLSIALAGAAVAEPDSSALASAITSIDQPRGALIPIRDDQATFFVPGATPPSRIIFLNRCASGCTVYVGNENSRTQTSSIVSGTSQLTAFPFNDATWQALVTCVKATYAPFNIQITDVDPGNVSHWENIVAGTYSQIGGDDPNVVGVSPWRNGTPQIIANSITFTFAASPYYGQVSDTVDTLCWTVSQETAHSFGLDHEDFAADPMTYLDGSLPKRFQNAAEPCGSDCKPAGSNTTCAAGKQTRTCNSGSPTQNSYAMLVSTFGTGTAMPPKVTITDPKNGAQVQAGFPVHADITADDGVEKVELYVDGKLGQSLTTAPFAFNAPSTLVAGTHHVELRAYDALGTPGSGFIDVVIGPPCTDGTCDTGKACVDGRCVAGPGTPGGLGEPCTKGSDCVSGACNGAAGSMLCTEECDPTMNGCPSGFTCAMTTDPSNPGACWPGGATGDGGTSAGCNADGGTSGALPIGLGFAFTAFALRRRRKR